MSLRRRGFERSIGWALLLIAGLASCDASVGSASLTVVTGVYPYAFVAQQVGGETVEVINLTAAGVEPHDVELSPQQIAEVAGADLVVYQPGFQPALDEAVDQSGSVQVLDIGARTPSAAADPHLWLDPTELTAVADAVTTELAELRPARADSFRSNARELATQLQQLDRSFQQGLADCERRVFVASHAAFGYLARQYDLRLVAISGLDPHLEPSPARQAQVADTIESRGITTVFTEPLASPAVAESVAAETGTTVATLDPIEGLADDGVTADYLSLMRANLAALRQANGCQ